MSCWNDSRNVEFLLFQTSDCDEHTMLDWDTFEWATAVVGQSAYTDGFPKRSLLQYVIDSVLQYVVDSVPTYSPTMLFTLLTGELLCAEPTGMIWTASPVTHSVTSSCGSNIAVDSRLKLHLEIWKCQEPGWRNINHMVESVQVHGQLPRG